MKSELAEEIFELIEARSQNRPTPMEFEMAYQARIAIYRIRFAIRHAEQFAPGIDPRLDVGLQLLEPANRGSSVPGTIPTGVGDEVGKANNSRQRPDGGQLGLDNETNGRVRTRRSSERANEGKQCVLDRRDRTPPAP
jgi:hypothetical protein